VIFLLAIIRVALKALGRNKMRSALTMLGIVIGVGAVIAMVSIVQGASAEMVLQIANAGSNLVMVMPGSFNNDGVQGEAGTSTGLSEEDYRAIQRECSAVRWATPSARVTASIAFGNRNWSTSVQGVNTNFLNIKMWQMARGSFFSERDISSNQRVCVIGKTVADTLFPGVDPINREVRINNVPWRVVGVLKLKGQTGVGQDPDDTILAPYTTVTKRLQRQSFIQSIMVSAVSRQASAAAQQQIADLLRQRHSISGLGEDDFTVRNLTDIAEIAQGSIQVMTTLLASIALVSLVIGGIGIMNIMLVSVTERTREIGIRMSVGATAGNIQLQFLVEAIVLAAAGGALGILCGFIASKLISDSLGWPTLVSAFATGLALSFSGAIGISSGWYPARKAAGLDPIKALRHG
jgi:putative ABC transport system permease protein